MAIVGMVKCVCKVVPEPLAQSLPLARLHVVDIQCGWACVGTSKMVCLGDMKILVS